MNTSSSPFGSSSSPFSNGGGGGGEKAICHHFRDHGSCKFGDSCRYSHDIGGSGGSGGFGEASSPFGASSSPFGGSSSPFGASTSPFGSTGGSVFGGSSSPFGAPAEALSFEKVANDFSNFFFSRFCSEARGELKALMVRELFLWGKNTKRQIEIRNLKHA